MKKTIYSAKQRIFLDLLRSTRQKAGISQVELAKRLNETQSFISKCERGERRLDIVEVLEFCNAMRVSFPDFAQRLEERIFGE